MMLAVKKMSGLKPTWATQQDLVARKKKKKGEKKCTCLDLRNIKLKKQIYLYKSLTPPETTKKGCCDSKISRFIHTMKIEHSKVTIQRKERQEGRKDYLAEKQKLWEPHSITFPLPAGQPSLVNCWLDNITFVSSFLCRIALVHKGPDSTVHSAE